jgi:hypothetical protein
MAMDKVCGTYYIRNLINQKYYVGSSHDIYTRWKTHLRQLRNGIHHCAHLQKSWNKYGENSFEFIINQRFDLGLAKKELFAYEQAEIDGVPKNLIYNSNSIAGKPPRMEGIKAREHMMKLWKAGRMNCKLIAIERICSNTGQVTEYESISQAVQDGFESSCISAVCCGKKASYANYYWRYLDNPAPEFKARYVKIFLKVRGTKPDGTTIELTSFDECHSQGFNYGKIRGCCQGVRGRRTHRGYTWAYVDEHIQSTAETNRYPTHKEKWCKKVIGVSLDGTDVRHYDGAYLAEADGFNSRTIGACCRGERNSHKGYRWRFA